MSELLALVATDLVGSTQLNERLGDERMHRWWEIHDQTARDLLRRFGGREVGRADGFLLLFESTSMAVKFVSAYHEMLAAMAEPTPTRAAIHFGPVTLRMNSQEDVAQGSVPFEIDGISLPLTMRLLSIAGPGHTLLSGEARTAISDHLHNFTPYGHWMFKGLADPIAVFGLTAGRADLPPPIDGDKAYRVTRSGEGWRPACEIANNLAPEPNAFIGRRAILSGLAERFDAGAWLVTVCGIGGVGKTRLAQCFARRWLASFPGGVWFTDLASAHNEDEVLHGLAHSLGVGLGREPLTRLSAAIASRKRCLVILDNLEHLVEPGRPVLAELRTRAVEARFLVTSRQQLDLEGEEVLPLDPLEHAEAVDLFRERVRALGVRQALDEDHSDAVDSLVALLDHLPLAIELAAARSRLMLPAELLRHAGDRLAWPETRHGRPSRHATLRATLDWSWGLLSAAEQRALIQLSSFVGGFTLDAAEAVIVPVDVRREPAAVNIVQALVERSLVRSPVDGRLDLLGAVREYASTQGHDDVPSRSAARRHATYFARQAGTGKGLSLCELANVSAATRRMAAAGDVPLALSCLEGAWELLKLRGPFGVVLELATEVAAMADLDSAGRARAGLVQAWAFKACGRSAEAQSHFEAAAVQARLAGEVRIEALALSLLGDLQVNLGQLEPARETLDAALIAAVATGSGVLECEARTPLANLHRSLGNAAAAKEQYEIALAKARQAGLRRWEGGSLGNLGMLAAEQGSPEADGLCAQALAIARELGDRQWEANTLCNMGLLHHLQHRSLLAAEELTESLRAAREMGHARLQAIVLCNLGIVTEELKQAEAAREHYLGALEIAHVLSDRRTQSQVLGYLGALSARQGEFAQARRYLDEALVFLEEMADRTSLGLLHCARAECALLSGNADEARAALALAEAAALEVGAGPGSELQQALARLHSMISASSAQPA